MKEALYYIKQEDSVLCTLCPHMCKLKNGETGFCGVRRNVDGILYSLNYKKVSSIAIDPIEKKPLYKFRPGSKILSIGSLGCNFNCKFCQNYSISREFKSGDRSDELSPRDIIDLLKAEKLDSLAFTYNEPTVFYEMMLETAKLAKAEGYKTVMVTNGYINKKPFMELSPYIDAMNIDVKSSNDKRYKEVCAGSLEPVLSTIRAAIEANIHVELTCLLVPTLFGQEKEIRGFFRKLSEVSGKQVLHLSRYFPRYEYNEPATSIDWMLKVKAIALEFYDEVYLGNV